MMKKRPAGSILVIMLISHVVISQEQITDD